MYYLKGLVKRVAPKRAFLAVFSEVRGKRGRGAGALSARAQGAPYRAIVRADRFITSLCPQ